MICIVITASGGSMSGQGGSCPPPQNLPLAPLQTFCLSLALVLLSEAVVDLYKMFAEYILFKQNF